MEVNGRNENKYVTHIISNSGNTDVLCKHRLCYFLINLGDLIPRLHEC